MLVSGVYQSDSVIYIDIFTFFSVTGYYKILNFLCYTVNPVAYLFHV